MKRIQYLLMVLCLLISDSIYAQQWSPHGNGHFYNPGFPYGGGGYPSAMLPTDSFLYLTGGFRKYFTATDTIITNQMGKWDGTQLFTIGNGSYTDGYSDLIFYKGKLYAAESTHIAIWDGTQWLFDLTGAGGGTISSGKVFLNYHDTLFIGGSFYIDQSPYSQDMVGWDGANWINVGYVPSVKEMVIYKDTIYASSYYGLYRRTGPTQWEVVNIGATEQKLTVDTFNQFLYMSYFNNDIYYNGQNLTNTAYYDGHSWHAAGQGIDSIKIYDLMLYHGYLYAGGENEHSLYNAPVYSNLYQLTDTGWAIVPGAIFFGIDVMAVFQDDLYLSEYKAAFDTDTTDTIFDLVRLHMPPDTNCHYLQPRAFVDEDTVYLSGGTVNVNFENNNPYVDSWHWDFGDSDTANTKDPLHTYTDTGTFNVTVTVTHQGCVKTANVTVTVLNNTGIINQEPLSISDFKIYPNPTKHNFTLEVTMPEQGQFAVYSTTSELMQQLVLQRGKNKTIISTDGWQPGTYICKIMIKEILKGSKKLILTK